MDDVNKPSVFLNANTFTRVCEQENSNSGSELLYYVFMMDCETPTYENGAG